MAYTAGHTILDDEYNIFLTGNANGTQNNTNNNVNTVNGVGSGDRGYGQTTTGAVSAGTVITATQWANMLNDISNVANHQGSSITAITNPVAGNTIAILAALSGNITTVTTNRNNAAGVGTTTALNTDRTTSWNVSVTATQTVTFPSANQLRYFFNAGGRLSLQFSRTGGTAANKNTGWSNLCTAMGTVYLTGAATSKTIAATAYTGTTKIGGSGTPTIYNTAIGAYALTGAYQNLIRQYDTTVQYTLNYITVSALISGNVITLRTVYTDDANASTDELVDGTLRTTVTAHYPSTTYLTNSWGTVTLGGSQTGS